MAKLEVTNEQLRLIQQALDFYCRVGIGQFTVIKDHPTFEKHLWNKCKDDNSGKVDSSRYRDIRHDADHVLTDARNILYDDRRFGTNGGWGIHHSNVDNSCRDAFDLVQVIRHEFWKQDPDRSNITVDSSVHITNANYNIKVEL